MITRKKNIILLLMIMLMMLSLVACARKKSLYIEFKNIDGFEIVSGPADVKNLSQQDNVLQMTLDKDGVYTTVIKVNGNEYPVTISFEDGDASVDTNQKLDYTLTIK